MNMGLTTPEFGVIQQQLEFYLPHLNEEEGPFEFYELCGFLMAICSAPEMIQPSAWMPIILGEELKVPESLGEPNDILGAIMDLYNWINGRILTGENPLPDELDIREDVFSNFGEHAPVGQWSRGFYEAHDWLHEVWDEYINDEIREELTSYLMPLSFFVDENYARAIHEDVARKDKSFEEVAEYMILLFKHAAMDYSVLGRTIAETIESIEEPDTAKTQFDEPSVDRDAPCPCGSGKPYKKCCLH